jgi:hypothetical protein
LPIATKSQLGTVIVGHGLDIEDDGRLDVVVDNALSLSSVHPVQNKAVTERFTEDDRFHRSLVAANLIPNNTDLNTDSYLAVGRYYVGTNGDAATLSHCPTTRAFMMEVFSLISNSDIDTEAGSGRYMYRTREINDYEGNTWVQDCGRNVLGVWTYGSWNKRANTSDIGNGTLTIQKNGTTIDTFTANAASNKTVNISVPTFTPRTSGDFTVIDFGTLHFCYKSATFNNIEGWTNVGSVGSDLADGNYIGGFWSGVYGHSQNCRSRSSSMSSNGLIQATIISPDGSNGGHFIAFIVK